MRVVAKKKFADGTRKDSDDYASVEVLEQMGLLSHKILQNS